LAQYAPSQVLLSRADCGSLPDGKREQYGPVRMALPDLLSLEKFIDYGMWFQRHVLPDLDKRTVVKVPEETATNWCRRSSATMLS
jgi:hypothetical protein